MSMTKKELQAQIEALTRRVESLELMLAMKTIPYPQNPWPGWQIWSDTTTKGDYQIEYKRYES